MIPLSVFNIMIAIVIVLFLYSIIDSRNKYYGNIIAAFVCALIAIYLAVTISVGVVQYDPAGPLITLTDESTTAWYCIGPDDEVTPVSDPSECEDLQQKSFAVNTTVSIPQCYHCQPVEVIDPSIGFILMIFSIIMMIYTALMIYDAYLEYKMEPEDMA